MISKHSVKYQCGTLPWGLFAVVHIYTRWLSQGDTNCAVEGPCLIHFKQQQQQQKAALPRARCCSASRLPAFEFSRNTLSLLGLESVDLPGAFELASFHISWSESGKKNPFLALSITLSSSLFLSLFLHIHASYCFLRQLQLMNKPKTLKRSTIKNLKIKNCLT